MYLGLLYAVYWIVLGCVIWRSEKKVAWLEEENRHLKELLDIRNCLKNSSSKV